MLQRREKGRAMVEEVKRYRSEMGSMIQDLKDKQDRMQILNEETSKLNKNINRCALSVVLLRHLSRHNNKCYILSTAGPCTRTALWTSRTRS